MTNDKLKAMIAEREDVDLKTRERKDTVLKTDGGMLVGKYSKDEHEEKKKVTHTFQPVPSLQVTKDPIKLQREQLSNLAPLKRDDTIIEINLRSIVNMDNEPMYF